METEQLSLFAEEVDETALTGFDIAWAIERFLSHTTGRNRLIARTQAAVDERSSAAVLKEDAYGSGGAGRDGVWMAKGKGIDVSKRGADRRREGFIPWIDIARYVRALPAVVISDAENDAHAAYWAAFYRTNELETQIAGADSWLWDYRMPWPTTEVQDHPELAKSLMTFWFERMRRTAGQEQVAGRWIQLWNLGRQDDIPELVRPLLVEYFGGSV